MTIYANIRPLMDNETRLENPMYRILEIHMQSLGCLLPYREELNWNLEIDSIELGSSSSLQKLKKVAANNDGVFLLYAKLTKRTVYEHLIGHPNDKGIYLPFEFNRPFFIKHNNTKLWLGSAIRLQEELKWLKMTMDNQTEDISSYWSNLRHACEVSIDNNSPMILINS